MLYHYLACVNLVSWLQKTKMTLACLGNEC